MSQLGYQNSFHNHDRTIRLYIADADADVTLELVTPERTHVPWTSIVSSSIAEEEKNYFFILIRRS